jgi:hypothetical protein
MQTFAEIRDYLNSLYEEVAHHGAQFLPIIDPLVGAILRHAKGGVGAFPGRGKHNFGRAVVVNFGNGRVFYCYYDKAQNAITLRNHWRYDRATETYFVRPGDSHVDIHVLIEGIAQRRRLFRA